ncbi:MAG: aspartate carbamoyltransferase catalytic subunit [Candidatus Eisenbacteria bacterium]|nr:aspartate carbamoyltransferase catalytic subunit [Candidatus Eisenbacteria bacterium]
MLNRKDLLGLEDLTKEEIVTILDTASSFKEVLERPIRKVPALRGKTVVNLFFEPSTRTRISFEMAEKRLSADTISFSQTGSSVSKGETLKDTAKNIEAMEIDAIVIRHSESGAPHFLARNLDSVVINAGDGSHEHPTQGLLDLLTVREKKGNLAGLKMVIIGDIAHSRVARSDIWGFTKLGADVSICGPSTMIPAEVEKFGVRVHTRIEEALEGVDVVNVLRIQLERQGQPLFPSVREYAKLFGIDGEKLKRAKSDCIVMHPGPINRGVEIDNEVADGAHSVILGQVTNGVAVRMAVLYLLVGKSAPFLPLEEGEKDH